MHKLEIGEFFTSLFTGREFLGPWIGRKALIFIENFL
jgi:hypothetical protein